jgi:hypothetical protein
MVNPIDDEKWKEIGDRLMILENIFALGISKEDNHLTLRMDGHLETMTPEHFRWIIPKGELEGYH